MFGKNIRKLRIEQGYTQHHVAEEVGLTQGAVSQLENGKYPPDAPVALRFARLFKRSLEELLTPSPKPEQGISDS